MTRDGAEATEDREMSEQRRWTTQVLANGRLHPPHLGPRMDADTIEVVDARELDAAEARIAELEGMCRNFNERLVKAVSERDEALERVAELEKPDMFWDVDNPEYSCEGPHALVVSIGPKACELPFRFEMDLARSLGEATYVAELAAGPDYPEDPDDWDYAVRRLEAKSEEGSGND